MFGRAFWGSFAGRITATIFLAILAALGIGADFWVRSALAWWGAESCCAVVFRTTGLVIEIKRGVHANTQRQALSGGSINAWSSHRTRAASFDHLVGAGEQRRRHRESPLAR
jgi:hypothetical protein